MRATLLVYRFTMYTVDIFKRKWLIQCIAGLDTNLSIPAESWFSTKSGDEWTQINGLFGALGVSTSTQAVITSEPFLRVFPGLGSSRSNDGEVPTYISSGSTTQFKPGQVRRRFTIQLAETRAGILDTIQYVANLSNFASATGQSPILILDFCWPEVTDIMAARPTGFPPYTVRAGMIDSISLPGPSGGIPGFNEFRATGSNPEFSFIERDLRRVI
jgi:hypothetical protein